MDDDTDAERLLAGVRAMRRGVRSRGGGPVFRDKLTGAQAELLRVIARDPQISVGDAAKKLSLAGNTVSTLVRQLVDLGYVVREPDPDDARTARLRLTEETAETLRGRRDERHASVVAALTALDPELRSRVDDAINVLNSVAAALEQQQ